MDTKRYFLPGSFWFLLGGVVLLGLQFSLAYFGHYGFDDLQYAELAHGWLKGNYLWDDHYSYRWTILAGTAISYFVFGVNDLASALPAMLITLGTLNLLVRHEASSGRFAVQLSLALVLTCPWWLFYADKLMPDIYLAFFMTWAWLSVFKGRFNNQPITDGLFTALALWLAFLTKGTVVLAFPVLFLWFVHDLARRQHLRFWSIVAAGAFLGLLLYLGFFWVVQGDPLLRFKVIGDNAYLNACSYDRQPWPVLLDRVLFGFWRLIVREGFGPFLLLAIAGLIGNSAGRFFHLTVLGLFLAANFMTISPSHYVPMCLDPRHYLYLVPVGALSSGYVLSSALRQKKMWWLLLFSWGLLVLGTVFWANKTTTITYIFFGLIWWVVFRFVKSEMKPGILVLFTFFIGLGGILPRWNYHRSVKYRKQIQAYNQEVRPRLNNGDQLITDLVQFRMIRYFEGFEGEVLDRLHVFRYSPDPIPSKGDTTWVLVNGHTQYLGGTQKADWPDWLRTVLEGAEAVWQSSNVRGLSLYGVPVDQTVGMDWDSFFVTDFDYESTTFPSSFWIFSFDRRSGELAAQGDFCERVDLYSATLSLPLSGFPEAWKHALRAAVRLQVRFEAEADCRLVFQVEQNGETTYWKAFPFQNWVKALGNWFPIEITEILPPDVVTDRSTLKVYLWNPGLKPIFLDDLSVSLASGRSPEG